MTTISQTLAKTISLYKYDFNKFDTDGNISYFFEDMAKELVKLGFLKNTELASNPDFDIINIIVENATIE